MESKPAYLALSDRIRSAIDARNINPGSFLGTEVELSKNHSLARMTVRRAVQILIDEGLLERLPGRGIFVRDKSHQTRTVKMLAGNLCWMPAVQMARAAQKVAKDKGVELILCDAHGSLEDDIAAINNLPYTGVRGAIIMSLHCKKFYNALCTLITANFPFVVVDQHLHEIDAPCVCADNFGGGKLAATAIVDAGHEKIAFIGDLEASTTKDRLDGVVSALDTRKLKLVDSLDIQVVDRFADWEPQIKVAMGNLMNSQYKPTAVICSCDTVARAAYRTLADLGIDIPSDVSVVGFDDDPLAEWLNPPLSTIRQPFEDIGRTAMELLIERISNPEATFPPKSIAVEYVERMSVAQPSKTSTKKQKTA